MTICHSNNYKQYKESVIALLFILIYMGQFSSYKQVEKYIKDRTDKEFFITNTKGNDITIVISRNNKLLVNKVSSSYMSWLGKEDVDEMIKFIEQ